METNMSNSCPRVYGPQRQRERGFSLLEMVVAMFVLTIGLLGVASAIGYALLVSNSGRGLPTRSCLWLRPWSRWRPCVIAVS